MHLGNLTMFICWNVFVIFVFFCKSPTERVLPISPRVRICLFFNRFSNFGKSSMPSNASFSENCSGKFIKKYTYLLIILPSPAGFFLSEFDASLSDPSLSARWKRIRPTRLRNSSSLPDRRMHTCDRSRSQSSLGRRVALNCPLGESNNT